MSADRNEFITYQRTAGFDFKTEFDVSGNILYFGEAYPGALIAEAKWRIWKGEYDASNRQTSLRWADKNDNYDKIWNSRGSYNYTDI